MPDLRVRSSESQAHRAQLLEQGRKRGGGSQGARGSRGRGGIKRPRGRPPRARGGAQSQTVQENEDSSGDAETAAAAPDVASNSNSTNQTPGNGKSNAAVSKPTASNFIDLDAEINPFGQNATTSAPARGGAKTPRRRRGKSHAQAKATTTTPSRAANTSDPPRAGDNGNSPATSRSVRTMTARRAPAHSPPNTKMTADPIVLSSDSSDASSEPESEPDSGSDSCVIVDGANFPRKDGNRAARGPMTFKKEAAEGSVSPGTSAAADRGRRLQRQPMVVLSDDKSTSSGEGAGDANAAKNEGGDKSTTSQPVARTPKRTRAKYEKAGEAATPPAAQEQTQTHDSEYDTEYSLEDFVVDKTLDSRPLPPALGFMTAVWGNTPSRTKKMVATSGDGDEFGGGGGGGDGQSRAVSKAVENAAGQTIPKTPTGSGEATTLSTRGIDATIATPSHSRNKAIAQEPASVRESTAAKDHGGAGMATPVSARVSSNTTVKTPKETLPVSLAAKTVDEAAIITPKRGPASMFIPTNRAVLTPAASAVTHAAGVPAVQRALFKNIVRQPYYTPLETSSSVSAFANAHGPPMLSSGLTGPQSPCPASPGPQRQFRTLRGSRSIGLGSRDQQGQQEALSREDLVSATRPGLCVERELLPETTQARCDMARREVDRLVAESQEHSALRDDGTSVAPETPGRRADRPPAGALSLSLFARAAADRLDEIFVSGKHPKLVEEAKMFLIATGFFDRQRREDVLRPFREVAAVDAEYDEQTPWSQTPQRWRREDETRMSSPSGMSNPRTQTDYEGDSDGDSDEEVRHQRWHALCARRRQRSRKADREGSRKRPRQDGPGEDAPRKKARADGGARRRLPAW